jgi:medium-chain acyl-[acyl-carrier-protein] hydrolase
MPDSRIDERRWLKRFGRRSGSAEIRLLCLHHAGGNSGMYRQWPRVLPGFIEPVAIQLPGRADRFGERPYDRMVPLIDDLIEVLTPLIDEPFACYGVSMGARVAWTLAHELRDRGLPSPRALFVAACAAPCLDDGHWDWDSWEDDLEGYVRTLGGTPVEVLAEPELLRALLPVLRADLAVLSTQDFRPRGPLDMPIHAFAGASDPTAGADRMEGWRSETTSTFALDVLSGGHFFDTDGERRLIRTIGRELA